VTFHHGGFAVLTTTWIAGVFAAAMIVLVQQKGRP
jgi:hypothetical protein